MVNDVMGSSWARTRNVAEGRSAGQPRVRKGVGRYNKERDKRRDNLSLIGSKETQKNKHGSGYRYQMQEADSIVVDWKPLALHMLMSQPKAVVAVH